MDKFCIKIAMASEAETGTTFLKAVDIVHWVEHIKSQSMETMVVKGKNP